MRFAPLRFLPFLAVGSALVACSVEHQVLSAAGEPAADGEPAPEEETPRDAGAPARDAGKDAKAPPPAPTSTTPPPPPAPLYPAPLDEVCSAPVASPDGSSVVYNRCPATPGSQLPLVHRDLASGTSTVLTAAGSGFREGRPSGILFHDGQLRLASWNGTLLASLPVGAFVESYALWRLRVSGSDLLWPQTTATGQVNGSHPERFTLYTSGSATPIETGTYTATYITVPYPVLSEDGAYVASLERYSSGLTSRLRVAETKANAPVTTYELSYFEPQWVRGGVVGRGAIFVSQQKLYHVSFTTGAVTALSTGPVQPNGQQPGRVYALVAGGRVIFADGAIRQNGSGAAGSFAIKTWDPSTPATPPVTVATGTDYLNAYTDVPMRLSPDGAFVVAAFEPPSVIAGTVLHVMPAAGGPTRVLAKSLYQMTLFPPAFAAWTDYDGNTTVEALDQSKKRVFPKSVTPGYRTAYVGKDAATIFLFRRDVPASTQTASWSLEATDFAGGSRSLLALPADAKLYSGGFTTDTFVPVQGGAVLARIPKGTTNGAADLVLLQ